MKISDLLQPGNLRVLVIATVLTAMTLLALHWRPDRQVELHQKNFLHAVEDRNWKKVGHFISPEYRDRWSQNRRILLERLPQIFGTFLACGVLSDKPALTWKDQACVLQAHIRIVGSGGPIAQIVIEQTAALKEPFAFTWQRQSWKPWDWQLVSVDQPDLQFPQDADFQL